MKVNPPIKKLGEVLERIVGGGTPSTSNASYWGGDIPWASVKDIKEGIFVLTGTKDSITEEGLKNSAATLAPKGTLIISTRMGLGRVVKAEIDTAINQDLKALFPKSGLDVDYLLLFLRANAQEIISKGSGATVSGIRIEHIRNLEIPLPPIGEQRKIVARLENLLGKIKEAKRLRAEAQENTDNLLSAELHKIFEEGKKMGWKEKMIGDVAPIMRESNKKLLPYVGMEGIESNSGKFIGSLEPKKVKSNTFYFDQSCVLYGRLRPYLNKVLMPDFEGHCSTEMFPLVPDQKYLLRAYFWYWITQKSFVDRAMQTNKGSRMPRADMEEVMKFKIPLPPPDEQKKIVARLDKLSQLVEGLRQAQARTLSDLVALEQSVLHQAFNG